MIASVPKDKDEDVEAYEGWQARLLEELVHGPEDDWWVGAVRRSGMEEAGEPADLPESMPVHLLPPVGAKPPAVKGSRRYAFTSNNYVVDDCGTPILFAAVSGEPRITFFVAGMEVAPTTGTPHLQGYLELKSPATMAQMQAWPAFAGLGNSFFLLGVTHPTPAGVSSILGTREISRGGKFRF